ncbi:MAG: Adenylate cyclase [Myxococcaceae bacterium]|nr:Adenylate cyclase [Myxococcaceae bacterium]
MMARMASAIQPDANHASHVTHLEELLALRSIVDDIVEEGLIARQNLAEVMATMLPAVCARLGARGAFVRSFGEDLAMQLFTHPEKLAIPRKDDVFERTSGDHRESTVVQEGGDMMVAQPLDVAGEWFGCAGLVFEKSSARASDPNKVKELLNLMCEELDNYLFAIRAAREKHELMMELARALRHRVLGEGLRQAVEVLTKAIDLHRMLLVYVAEENAESTLHVHLFDGGGALKENLVTTAATDAEREQISREGREYLHGNGTALLKRLAFEGAQEEVLINGVTKSVVVGKVVASSKHGAFNTYSRELLGGFAGFIRQRVVDFNKEWRRLAASFRAEDVARLLQRDDYETRYLAPREEPVAMLYVDIAGFTRLSEQVLKTPSAVAELVEDWSKDAVDLVWEHGGVFDKMVGDCVIALFGPPFYEDTPGECLARAIRCAVAIRDMTRRIPERTKFEVLRKEGVAVSTGVNLAPLFVGTFGPNSNFTGFSSGMNNTARLQGCAKRDEILVMADSITQLPEGHKFRFSEELNATVKNVAAPLRFRAVITPSFSVTPTSMNPPPMPKD